MEEGVLAAHGIREVGLPGYLEGHPRIPEAQIEQAMSRKLALIAEQGLGGVHRDAVFIRACARSQVLLRVGKTHTRDSSVCWPRRTDRGERLAEAGATLRGQCSVARFAGVRHGGNPAVHSHTHASSWPPSYTTAWVANPATS